MPNKLFLIGHGLQYTSGERREVPTGATVHFAVPSAYRSTRGISSRHLSGALTTYSETLSAGDKYFEHFLCPDAPWLHEYKMEMFHTGAYGKDSKYWLVCARGRRDVALSKIIARVMEVGLSQPVEFVWTCCRSPINQLSKGELQFLEGRGVVPDETLGKVPSTLPMTKDHEVHLNDARGVLTILSSEDIVAKKGMRWKIGTGMYSAATLFGDPFSATGNYVGDDALSS